MKHIQFLDLQRQYISIKPHVERAIQHVLNRQCFILGEEVKRFEQEFAHYLIEKFITKRTKAIMPVHLYGAACEIDSIVKIAKKYKLFVIEDASQAHGSMYGNKKLGTLADIGIFSFYPTKNLGAYGDARFIVTNNKNLYETFIKLRNYGQSQKNYSDIIGINSRLNEIQAAVLRIKLKYLDTWNQKKGRDCKVLY